MAGVALDFQLACFDEFVDTGVFHGHP
jgi:hypothetical protein